VVDVRDDREVADVVHIKREGHHTGALGTWPRGRRGEAAEF
jgi:hypothetical protein